MKTRWYLLLFLGFNGFSLSAQTGSFGFLPTLNYNINLKNEWKLNGKLENRLNFESPIFNLIDFQLGVAYKNAPNQSISGGYLIRFDGNDTFYHRFIQQYTVLSQIKGVSIGQRFRADQTFGGTRPSYRLRYRLSFLFPFSGEFIDKKEFYFKINNEYLVEYSNLFSAEFRVIPLIGYQFKSKNKLEYGFDYRFSEVFNPPNRNNLWATIAYYFTL